MELLEVLFSSCRMFPWIVKAVKSSAFLCCWTLGVDAFTKWTVSSIHVFLCRWRKQLLHDEGNDNWTSLLRTPDLPSSPAASEDSEALTCITLFVTLLEMQSLLAFDECSKLHHLSPCHLWGQKQFDSPKISSSLFFKGKLNNHPYHQGKPRSDICRTVIKKNHARYWDGGEALELFLTGIAEAFWFPELGWERNSSSWYREWFLAFILKKAVLLLSFVLICDLSPSLLYLG